MFRYYIIFADDYSWASWVYLLKDYSKVFFVVWQFLYEIIAQFPITLDVSNAFLYNELFENVYMELPLGYVVEGESRQDCHLRHVIYGFKQSLCA